MATKKIKVGATYSIPVNLNNARMLKVEANCIVSYTLVIGVNNTPENTQLAKQNIHSIPAGATASIVNNAPLNQGSIATLKIYY
jgi:hypothetical protein